MGRTFRQQVNLDPQLEGPAIEQRRDGEQDIFAEGGSMEEEEDEDAVVEQDGKRDIGGMTWKSLAETRK